MFSYDSIRISITFVESYLKPNNLASIDEILEKNFYSNRMVRARKSLAEIKRIEKGWTRSENDDSTGSGGEIREFHIDFGYYINCLLPRNKPFYVKKYYLQKGDKIEFDLDDFEYEEDAIAYIASFEEEKINTKDPPEVVLWNEYLAVRVCAEGKSDFVVANRMLTSDSDKVGSSGNYQSARRCGFSTILSYLCYLDRETESSIKGASELGYDFEVEFKQAKDTNEREQLKRFIAVVEKSCKRILKVVTNAKPSAGGRSYIYAGMDAGYQYLMTIGKDKINAATVHHMKKLNRLFGEKPPTKIGEEIVDPVLDDLIEKGGNKWFFCKCK